MLRVTSLSKSTLFKKFLMLVLPTKAKVLYILMLKNIINNIITENFREEISMNYSKLLANLMDKVRNAEVLTLLSGKKHNPNTSCTGQVLGAKVFLVGILNVQQWEQSILEKLLTFMEVEWI